ncbi:methoxymalonate biosynthesis protein [Saccharothrix sp. ALI-22-I]|uniref:acyl carrier protein n=1 Tax=Saccharothrix sp. ALI-22-I TaxID=1933778 RepID=UPI00097C5A5D|nr:acyl carrier protein [Saccharothrix sp. ALI-22-I]ONI91077.1 methoxymalonate biosynthesis protein [Saccharothrix sp. ALI-22-I]
MTTTAETRDADDVRRNLLEFLKQRAKAEVEPDFDLFAGGLVSSLFALELVVHLENAFGVTVGGEDLKIDNFRTVDAMTALVVRSGGARG